MTANPTPAHAAGARRSTANRPAPRRRESRRSTARPVASPAWRPVPGPDWPARVLGATLFLAVIAMLSLPQARAASTTFGLLPLWLVGLPATAWLALAGARRRGARG